MLHRYNARTVIAHLYDARCSNQAQGALFAHRIPVAESALISTVSAPGEGRLALSAERSRSCLEVVCVLACCVGFSVGLGPGTTTPRARHVF